MEERFCRTAMLIGETGLARLRAARVAVFGIGGVGSFAAEALARAGVGRLVLVDNDVVAASNLNRQLAALQSTLGRSKAAVMKERIEDIQPAAEVEVIEDFTALSTISSTPSTPSRARSDSCWKRRSAAFPS